LKFINIYTYIYIKLIHLNYIIFINVLYSYNIYFLILVPLKKLTEQDLYINYLVLMKLGFKDEHIQEAFLRAESFSIESLLEWVFQSFYLFFIIFYFLL